MKSMLRIGRSEDANRYRWTGTVLVISCGKERHALSGVAFNKYVDTNLKNPKGRTVFHLPLRYERFHVLWLLLNCMQVDANEQEEGNTSIHSAVRKKLMNIAEMLLKN